MANKPPVEELDVLIELCAGIDVGQPRCGVRRVPDQAGKRCPLIETLRRPRQDSNLRPAA